MEPDQAATRYWLELIESPRERAWYAIMWRKWLDFAHLLCYNRLLEGQDEGWLDIGRFINEAGPDVVELLNFYYDKWKMEVNLRLDTAPETSE